VKKILFIGSHLSKLKGTKSASENVALLLGPSYEIKLTSNKVNQFSRILDILNDSLFHNYDIMHIDIYSGKALIYANMASIIAKFRKKKIIMNLHGGRLDEVHNNNPKKLILLNRAHKIITPSINLQKYFISNGFNVSYLPNYINKENFPYRRDNFQKYSLLWVRAFNDIYQPELAVKIVNKLKVKYPKVHLTMIGPDKGLQQSTFNLITQLKLENHISIKGSIQNDELHKYYQSNQVYLNTTLYESFGLAILEAASCGIPIVSTNVGEIPYIWEDSNEVILCESDEEEFSKKISSIFENSDFEKLLSLNARIKSEKFDSKKIKKQWESLFNEYT